MNSIEFLDTHQAYTKYIFISELVRETESAIEVGAKIFRWSGVCYDNPLD